MGLDPAQPQSELAGPLVHGAGRAVPRADAHLPAGARHLAQFHRHQDRPSRRLHRRGELRLALGGPGFLAIRLQHLPLHDRCQRHQVRIGLLLGDPSEQPYAVQGAHPGDRPAAVHRADGVVGDRLLVDLRHTVLGHQLDADQARPDRRIHQFSRRAEQRSRLGDLRQHLARHPVRRDHPARRVPDLTLHKRPGRRSTRRPPSTAPRAGRYSAALPIRC